MATPMHLRFDIPDETPLRAFAIAGSSALELLEEHRIRRYDPTSDADVAFCLAMNRANCLAYDGTVTPGATPGALGMPAWVLLDCCALPSAVFGFEAPRGAFPRDVADRLDPSGDLEWLGISEYIALPSLHPGDFVGVSLFSLAARRGLGRRTKAMALRVLGAARQIGVTQFTSPGVRLHLEFGPLRVVAPSVGVHSRPHETFVYSLELPSAALLAGLEAGQAVDWSCPIGARERLTAADPTTATRVAELHRQGPTFVVDAGTTSDGRVDWLDFVVADRG